MEFDLVFHRISLKDSSGMTISFIAFRPTGCKTLESFHIPDQAERRAIRHLSFHQESEIWNLESNLQDMLIPIDHIILDVGRQLCEIRAESPDANDQIPVVFRMNLGVPQFVGVHHVVLNMRSAV
jgi:hypothetical protein